MKNLIIIPGLGDDARYTKFITKNWEKNHGIKVTVMNFGWSGNDDKFQKRFDAIDKKIEKFLQENKNVSLLGISAGGSAVINLYSKRKDQIEKVICVCGRLRDPNIGRMWNHRKKDLGVFTQSVRLAEKNIEKLNEKDLEKFLTIRPIYDDVVPVRTMTLNGAKNKKVNAIQHMISIFLIMTRYSSISAKFINSDK